MNYYNMVNNRFNATQNQPPSYYQSISANSTTSHSSNPNLSAFESNNVGAPNYASNQVGGYQVGGYQVGRQPPSYSNVPPRYQAFQKRPISTSFNRELPPIQNGPQRYFGPSSAPSYATVPRNYSFNPSRQIRPAGQLVDQAPPKDNSPQHREVTHPRNGPSTPRNGAPQGNHIRDVLRTASPQGNSSNRSSPRQRYRTPEDYHYDYRGGYRPGTEDHRDGYTTDGSGSGIRENSTRGFENFRYPSERRSLLSGDKNTPIFAPSQKNGTPYSKESGEKQPFLGAVEPVRLTPSWEQRDVSKEELNFKNLKTFENFETEADPPGDRFALVFLTFVLHGVGTLMPWNMFITAKNYFVNYKFGTAAVDASEYTTNFLPYLGYASQIPNVLFNWINVFFQMGGGMTPRIVGSLVIEVIVFIATVVLAMVDSSTWPGIFFWATMACVIILNIAGGIYQNTIYGLAARLPFKYTGAVILGSNISGTFTAIINIAAIAMAPNQRTSAIYYFIAALFVLLACFDTYFALPLNRFYRYHDTIHKRTQRQSKGKSSKRGCCHSCKVNLPKIWYVFKKTFLQLFNVFMVFFVTLAVFPAVLADTCRTEENFFIPPKYFQAVTCFLTFNAFAMFGNMLPGLFLWPGPKFLCIPVILRLLFIPAFILCHYYPIDMDRVMPVLIDSDWAYWVLSIFLGLTSGYYSSLAMMYCPRAVEPELAPIAGMMGAASLITGIFAGINFQVVCSYVVTHVTFEIPGWETHFRNCTDRLLS